MKVLKTNSPFADENINQRFTWFSKHQFSHDICCLFIKGYYPIFAVSLKRVYSFYTRWWGKGWHQFLKLVVLRREREEEGYKSWLTSLTQLGWFRNNSNLHLTHFWPIFPFNTPWKIFNIPSVFTGNKMGKLARNELIIIQPAGIKNLLMNIGYDHIKEKSPKKGFWA